MENTPSSMEPVFLFSFSLPAFHFPVLFATVLSAIYSKVIFK